MKIRRKYLAEKKSKANEENIFDHYEEIPERALLVALLARAINDALSGTVLANVPQERERLQMRDSARSWFEACSHKPWGYGWLINNLPHIGPGIGEIISQLVLNKSPVLKQHFSVIEILEDCAACDK